MIRLRRAAAICAASFVVGAVLAPASVFAHTPVANSVGEYGQNTTLLYQFSSSGYPTWVTTASNGTLTVNWPSSSNNNSASPQFTQDASGTGRVVYSSSSTSPCSGNTGWLACADNWGTPSWHIYIRDLGGAPNGNWAWYDVSSSCPGGSTCFYARRSLIHEAEHVTLGVGNHDGQGETNTVMGASQPSASTTGWNTTTIRQCDESAAQLLYDVRTSSGPYSGCFDHITGHGTTGLISTASVGSSSYGGCSGAGVTATGRLAIKTDANYGLLTNNPLTGRTVFFDRRPVGGTWTPNVTSTTATNVSGNNWTKTFSTSSSITYEFRAHYGGETGVDASNQPTFTITWSTPC